MKISQPPDNTVALSSNAIANAAKSGVAANALPKAPVNKGAQPAGVAVTVSPLARSLEVAEGAAASDVDTAKVEAVRTAILKLNWLFYVRLLWLSIRHTCRPHWLNCSRC